MKTIEKTRKQLEQELNWAKKQIEWHNGDRAYNNFLLWKAGKITKKELDRRDGK